MILFLDLEETLIDLWETRNTLVSNVERIREEFLLTREAPPVLGLMSWAVWNDQDKSIFNDELRKPLEDSLGMTFADEFVFSMDDWARQLERCTRKKMARGDLFSLFGKQEVLFSMSRHSHLFHNQKVVLVDDAVEHRLSWFSPQNNCAVEILNITENWE